MDSKIKLSNLLRWIVRIAGSIALILGLLLWFGMSGSMLRPHMVLGIVTAVSLGAIAIVASVAGVRVPMALIGLVWAALTIFVGYNQNAWMAGSSHWVIEAVHLILGVGAIGMAESLAAGIARRSI